MSVEKLKADVMKEDFRQEVFRRTSEDYLAMDESKRPSYAPVNESFRKLAVD